MGKSFFLHYFPQDTLLIPLVFFTQIAKPLIIFDAQPSAELSLIFSWTQSEDAKVVVW